VTTNDLRAGERMRHRGVVSHHSSLLLSDDFGVVITRRAGSAVSVTPRPAVLVKGIAMSSRYVHPLAEQSAKCGEVVRIDLPGLGAAPGPKRDVWIPLNADVLCAFPHRPGVGNPMLAGHSIGTPVVTHLATGYLARCGIRCFFAPVRFASLTANEPA